MRSVTVRLDDLRTMILNLGFVGENEHRTFNFDCKKMFGEYPSASVSLAVQPPAGGCYPATVERDGDLVSWTVTDSDLTEEGCGEIQLTFMIGDVKAKTCIGRTKVERSLGAIGDIPTPIENWIERAEEVISDAEAATAAAEDAAEHQPIIDDNGYWAVWDADAEEYVATEYKAQGTDGQDGVGIVSIEKTGTSGLVDTYTITFTSGNPVTYTVTNGRDADPAELIDDTAGSGATDKVWSADKSSSLLTEIVNSVKTVNPGDLTNFPCKKNTYINNSGVETALDGYDTYYIPCSVNSFVHIDWSAHSSKPWSGVTDGLAIKLHDNNNNIHVISGAVSIYGKYSESKKELIVIPDTIDSTVTITVLRAYAKDTIVAVGDPFVRTNPESNTDIRKTTRVINEKTSILSIFYFNNTPTSISYNYVMDLSDVARSAILPVKQGDKIQFTGVRQGLNSLGTLRTGDQTIRIETALTTNLMYTIPNDGILSVFYLYGGDYDAVIIPKEQITISADHVYDLSGAVQQELTGFQGEIDGLGDRIETVEYELSDQSVSYPSGSNYGYYRLNNDETEITVQYSDAFTYEKIEIAEWMHKIVYTIVSSTDINPRAVYLGFTDQNDALLFQDDHTVGLHETLIPSNAKYIYMSFYGATFNTGFTIEPDAFIRESDLGGTDFDGLDGVAFGTSLTYKAQTTGGYLNFLTQLSGITFDNQGVGSSCIYYDGGNLDMLAKIKAYNGYSGKRVALLEGFVNDWYNNRSLGTWKDTTETSVCGCVRSALNYMMSQNANMTIFLILDHVGKVDGSVDCSSMATRSAGLTQFEYYSEIEKVANSIGIPVIREFAESQISENTPQYLADNIHCSMNGARQSANFIWSKMKQYYPNVST